MEPSISAGTVGTPIGPLAPDTFAVGSGLNDSVRAVSSMINLKNGHANADHRYE